MRTTIRAAGTALDASLDIRKTGKHGRPFLQASLGRQLAAHAFYYAEALLLVVKRWRGEEILLEAEKEADSVEGDGQRTLAEASC
jgi:hypothetical protein